MTECGASEIAHQYRRTVRLRDHGRTDVRQAVHQTHAADDIALIASRDATATGIGIVIVDRVDDVGDAEAVVLQLIRIKIELILRGEAAEIGDLEKADMKRTV